jgi:hypothetical protein
LTTEHRVDAAARRRAVIPTAPRTLAESGLGFDQVLQLVVKVLHVSGELSGAALGVRLGLRHSVLEPVLHHLRSTYLCEVQGGGLVGGPSFIYRVSDAGRARAVQLLEQNRYVGAAPVPFSQYEAYMRAFDDQVARRVTRADVDRAMSHLVLSERVLDQIGPAVNGGHSLFVYGPPGNGKTVIAQGVKNLLDGDIAIPFAIEQGNHLVQVYDPVVHEDRPEAPLDQLDSGDQPDRRWLRCRRPLVTVGGVLTLGSLELAVDTSAGYYRAPIQLSANGGVLVIDDFGRQRCSAIDLLNRWITPLESRTDYLTLASGQKLPVPFVVLVVLATNIKPVDLVDEAFLRRIHYKVFAENPTVPQFKQIFRRCCRERSVDYDESVIDWLVNRYLRKRSIPLRGCQPRDLLDHALALADYRNQPRVLTEALMQAACESYFLDDELLQRTGGDA